MKVGIILNYFSFPRNYFHLSENDEKFFVNLRYKNPYLEIEVKRVLVLSNKQADKIFFTFTE